MQQHIVSHTAMRGIAALLVVAYHLQFGAQSSLSFETATPFFKVGYLWVDLFFILSGFVISYSSRLDERAPYNREQIKAFVVARFARIYPLHIVALGLLIAVYLGENAVMMLADKPLKHAGILSGDRLVDLVSQIFLINAWGVANEPGWNIPSWSISAEATAYLLFPLLAFLIARWRRTSLVAFALLAVTFYAWVGLTTGVLDIISGMAILRCLAGFGLGMVLYTQRDRFAALGDWTLGGLQFAGLATVLGTMLLGLSDVWAIPGFFLLVAATWTDRGWLAVPLRTRPLHWLGDISYSVYLNHIWVLSAWHFLSLPLLARLALPEALDRSIVLTGAYLLVLVISAVTYRYIEMPARDAIVSAYRRRKTAQASSTLPARNPLT